MNSVPPAESINVEFKSDRKRLPDNDLVEAVVCLANTEGGELWLGVEDDGQVTGLHKEHQNITGIAPLIAAKTSPSLSVQVEAMQENGMIVARITVPKSVNEIATTEGKSLRRRIKHDGTPECVPMLPHDRQSRASTLGLLDASAQAITGATLADLDPLERERLRQCVERYGGDKVLLELDDEAMDGALGLTARQTDGSRVPTLTGLLLIGREGSLRQFVPTHEFAFQVLAQEAVHINEFRRFPLLKLIEWAETNFRPYNPEQELQVGLFRVPVPKVEMAAFREAVANALIHRDYHRLGAIHVRLDDNGLTVSNPGGLVDGVTIANLLTTEPRPRNPALADAMKRIGLVERSGRGVDTIFRGMLRFGRPAPDYSRTDSNSVILTMPTVEADMAFLKLVVDEENRRNGKLPIDSLIALATLRVTKRLSAEELATQSRRDPAQTKRTLEGLVEAGLVEAHGGSRSRQYTLSAALYQAQGKKSDYTRQKGFSAIQNQQMVLNYVAQHGQIKKAEVMDLCRLSEAQAKVLIQQLCLNGQLLKVNDKKWAYYVTQ